MSNAKLIWATPDADAHLAYIARVSNPSNQENSSIEGLLRYMMREGHVSPFDMVNACIELNTTRDIGRQALRHYSIRPQEFSQRYATVDSLGDFVVREFRLQDTTNRQASIEVPADDPRALEWAKRQKRLIAQVEDDYSWCLKNGGAKECARVVLPEGLTPSRLYFNGSLRNWIFYLKSRRDMSTQKEHRILADDVLVELRKAAPVTVNVFFPEEAK